ncbi:MAG: response regulator [Oscillospiraceae bacterium]|jgi:signal transduction histidine kinase/CheY-like chemotaxis protein|nr:response regulator [Oscillospiraceae bacterium]
MNKKLQRLLISVVVGLLFVVLSMSVLLTIINNRNHSAILSESVEANLLSISVAARELLDIERFHSYNSREDVFDDYNAYYQTLASLRTLTRLTGASYIYALKEIDGEYFFIFDSDPFPFPDDPDRNDSIFEEYEGIGKVHLDAFGGLNSVGIMNLTDQWGTFSTGAVPIIRSGEVIGVISTDIEDRFIQASQQAATVNIIILVIVLTAVMGTNIIIIRRFVVMPLSRLTTSVSKSNIDENSVYGTYRDDEIGDLARKIQETLGEAHVANKAKSDFLATMSHEIRTPMNAILGITEMQLQNNELEKNMRESLEKVYSSGYMLLGIINDVLDLSKIEAGKLELLNENYEIASLLSDTVQLNVMRIGSKPIEFELYIDENLPVVLLGDELRIKQILNNVLSNAFKYTAAGMVTLSVTAEAGGADGEVTLAFSVSDTGQGMSKEQVDKLFDEYSQFNMKANRTTEGTGLGMSITRNLIRMMDGAIAIESEPEKGSTFTVRIPQVTAGPEVLGKEMTDNLHNFRTTSRTQMKRTQIVRDPMPYGNVLIVDDVETNIYVAKGLMVQYGINTDAADSGFAAIDIIKSGKVYDIIFMDHMMPKMDGVEATKILREMGYKEPIVALTANAVVGQSEIFLANGFDDFISKPIDTRLLDVVLNKLIRDKQPPEVIEAARKQAEAEKNKPPEQTAPAAPRPSIDVLIAESFVRDAKKSLAALDAVMEKGAPYSEDDIRTYIIHVHGMKSALANLGKKDLSAVAMKLEQSGRDNDIEFITAETPGFLDSLRAVVRGIAPQEEEVSADDATDVDMPYLRENLLKIKEACEEYDKNTAEEVLNELKNTSLPQKIRELLEAISEQLLHSDFDEVSEDIDKFMATEQTANVP